MRAWLTVGRILTGLACSAVVACESKSGGQRSQPRGTVVHIGSANKPLIRTVNTPRAKLADCYEEQESHACAIAKRILTISNELRATDSLPPFTMHAGWSHVATGWSKEQEQAAAISHDGFPDRRDAAYVAEFGNAEQPSLGAENVGRIDVGSDTVEEVAAAFANGWWQSPPHHKNLVGNYTHLGIGVVRSESGFYYATQLFAYPPFDYGLLPDSQAWIRPSSD